MCIRDRINKALEKAQQKVEARNFDIRKNLLEYDDVMNEQRKTVYKIRQQLLLGIYKPEIIDRVASCDVIMKARCV